MPILSATQLMCIKRDRVLFECLNLQLESAKIIHLKGMNGAGKTSLLRILAGLSQATEGKVYYRDEEIDKCNDQFCHDSLYIGHKSGVNGTLSAIENTVFWASQHGLSIEQDHAIALLGKLGLTGLEDLPVANLSAGQQRRVALARLWLKKQAVLWFLDEPFTALDVQGIALIEQKIHAHVESGGCAIVTSHQSLADHPLKEEFVLEYRF